MATRRPEDPAGRPVDPDGTGPTRTPGTVDAGGGRLRGAEAFRLHLTLGVGLAVCAAAFAFEVTRALSGNTLSWAYVFEWPIFAVFALYMWWHLLHGNDGSRRRRAPRDGPGAPSVGSGTARDGTDDADLVAWQSYLRSLEADDVRRAETDGPV